MKLGLALLSALFGLSTLASDAQSIKPMPGATQFIIVRPARGVKTDDGADAALKAALAPYLVDADAASFRDNVTTAFAVRGGQQTEAIGAVNKIKGLEATSLLSALSGDTSERKSRFLLNDVTPVMNAYQAFDRAMNGEAQFYFGKLYPNEDWKTLNQRIDELRVTGDWRTVRWLFQDNMWRRARIALAQHNYEMLFALMSVGESSSLMGSTVDSGLSLDDINRVFDVLNSEIELEISKGQTYLKSLATAIALERQKQGVGYTYLKEQPLEELFHYGGSDVKDFSFRYRQGPHDVANGFLFGNFGAYKQILRLLISQQPGVAALAHERLSEIIASHDMAGSETNKKIRAAQAELGTISMAYEFGKGKTIDESVAELQRMNFKPQSKHTPYGTSAMLAMIVQDLGYAAAMEFRTLTEADQILLAKRSADVLKTIEAKAKSPTLKELLDLQKRHLAETSSRREGVTASKAKNALQTSISTFLAPKTCEALWGR